MRAPAVAVAVVMAFVIAGCKQELEAKLGGAVLPQANGVVAAAETSRGPTVVVKPGAPVPSLPAGPVRLAVDIKVPWSQLTQVLDAAEAAGATPQMMVGVRREVHGFVLSDKLTDEYALRMTTSGAGKFCLSPPGTRDAYCVEGADHRSVSSLYVREAVRKAVAEYNIMQAWVVPDPDARWGDIVRTIDGARTCCGKRPFRVAVAR